MRLRDIKPRKRMKLYICCCTAILHIDSRNAPMEGLYIF